MTDPTITREPPRLHPAAGAVLGDADEAVLHLSWRPSVWISLHAMWAGVLATLLVGGYPRTRLVAVLAIHLATWFPFPLAIALRGRRGLDIRRLSGMHAWLTVIGAVLNVALTGGLASPIAFTMFLAVSVLFSRSGLSRAEFATIAFSCAAVLAMAVAPAAWLGPPIAQPFFTIVAVFAALATLGVNWRYVAALRDTAEAAVAQAIRAREDLAESALARARDLELVGARLSHELKNPLGAVKALSQISSRSSGEPLTRERLGVIEGEVDRMTEIVTSHLSFSRPLEPARVGTVHLPELARSVVSALRGRADAAGVRLSCRGGAVAVADGQRLKEALFNLVDNAILASPPGALVEVTIEQDERDVRVAVRDNGRGMPEEVLSRLGTPFFTTRENGTGLGVVLARAVFEGHGGTLQYQSAPGRGTTALGSLPCSPPT